MKRPYVSLLRDEQLEATRVRIVEAVARVLARGIVALSVPAVAREAEVSVATVYRHFPSKTELLRALAEHVANLTGTRWEDLSQVSLDNMEEKGRAIHRKLAQLDPALRLAMASPEANQLRRKGHAERLAANEKMLAPYVKHLSRGERRRVRDLCSVLMSSATANAFDMLVGSSPDETAATLSWGIRRIIGSDGR